jgi:hypothetical protein
MAKYCERGNGKIRALLVKFNAERCKILWWSQQLAEYVPFHNSHGVEFLNTFYPVLYRVGAASKRAWFLFALGDNCLWILSHSWSLPFYMRFDSNAMSSVQRVSERTCGCTCTVAKTGGHESCIPWRARLCTV